MPWHLSAQEKKRRAFADRWSTVPSGRLSERHCPIAVVLSVHTAIFEVPQPGGYFAVAAVMNAPKYFTMRTMPYSSHSYVCHRLWVSVSL